MSLLTEMLDHIEQHLDLDHLHTVDLRHRAILNYKTTFSPPITIAFEPEGRRFRPYPYAEAFFDPAKMMVNELLRSFGSVWNSVQLKDDFPLAIRSNHGIGIIASLFGVPCHIIQDNMPWVDSLHDTAAIKRLVDAGPPEPKGGLLARVLETHEFYHRTLANYPKCRQVIHITYPDLQGVFDIAHLIWGGEIYYAFQDEPELIRTLLDQIARTYVAVVETLRPTVSDSAGEGLIYLHGQIVRGRALLKNDSCVNLSPRLYEEFCRPFDARIIEELGGAGIHCCGKFDHLRDLIISIPGLQTLDFGNPEMNNMDEWYSAARERKICIVRLLLDQMGLSYADAWRRFPTGVSFFQRVASREEAERVLATARAEGAKRS